MQKRDAEESLVKNLRYLMSRARMSEKGLEKQSGVSQKAINNILNGVSSPTLKTVAQLAHSFGLTEWHLIMPNLTEELISSTSIEKLYKSYLDASAEGREHINVVAEREAKYVKTGSEK